MGKKKITKFVTESGHQSIIDVLCADEKLIAKLQAKNEKLRSALQYYFDVLEEVRGENWADKPDHVMQKFLEAMKPDK